MLLDRFCASSYGLFTGRSILIHNTPPARQRRDGCYTREDDHGYL